MSPVFVDKNKHEQIYTLNSTDKPILCENKRKEIQRGIRGENETPKRHVSILAGQPEWVCHKHASGQLRG